VRYKSKIPLVQLYLLI